MARPRFTIRGMMVLVALAAVPCVFVRDREAAFFATFLLSAVILAFAFWGSTRSLRQRAAWALGILALAVNGSVLLLNVYALNRVCEILMYVGSVVGFALMLGFGTAWATAASDRNASPRRRPALAWLLVLLAALTPLSMAVMHWPFYLAFVISRPALDRLASRVAAGERLNHTILAGLYPIVGAAHDSSTGDVALMLDLNRAGRTRFLKLAPVGPGVGPSRTLSDPGFSADMGNSWWYQSDDPSYAAFDEE